MANNVVGAIGGRSLAIFGAGSGSSPFFRKPRDGLADERRAATLDVSE